MCTSLKRRERRAKLQIVTLLPILRAAELGDENYQKILKAGYQTFGEVRFRNAVIRYIHGFSAKTALELAIQYCVQRAKDETHN